MLGHVLFSMFLLTNFVLWNFMHDWVFYHKKYYIKYLKLSFWVWHRHYNHDFTAAIARYNAHAENSVYTQSTTDLEGGWYMRLPRFLIHYWLLVDYERRVGILLIYPPVSHSGPTESFKLVVIQKVLVKLKTSHKAQKINQKMTWTGDKNLKDVGDERDSGKMHTGS